MTAAARSRLALIRQRAEAPTPKPAPPPPITVTVTLAADDLQFIRSALAAVSARRVMCPRSRRRARLMTDLLLEATR